MTVYNSTIQPNVNNSSVVLAGKQKLSEMSYEIKSFEHPKFGEMRIAEFKDGTVLFCLSDAARALDYANPAKAVIDHCKKGVSILETPTYNQYGAEVIQKMKFGKEGNLYRLAASSKLPEAESFQDWVFDDVLPTIRKTGSYSLVQQQMQQPVYSLEDKFKAIELSCKALRKSKASKTRMINYVIVPMGLPAFEYIESEGQFLSATDALSQHPVIYKGKNLSAVTFNKILIEKGYLEEVPQPRGKTSLKLLTEKGLKWGKNEDSVDHPGSIIAHYNMKKFPEFLKELGLK